MAGGGGTRLWPLSRDRKPKPFLPLLEDGSCLLAATVDRLSPLIEPADVYVVTDVRHAALVREAAAGRARSPTSSESPWAATPRPPWPWPRRPSTDRTTRSWSCFRPTRPSATMTAFLAALRAAAERAAGGDMVTLGIEPTEPSTGYGYVVADGPPSAYAGRPTFRVERFEEKPTPQRAAELIAGGAASWNAGIFVWRRDVAALRPGAARAGHPGAHP